MRVVRVACHFQLCVVLGTLLLSGTCCKPVGNSKVPQQYWLSSYGYVKLVKLLCTLLLLCGR